MHTAISIVTITYMFFLPTCTKDCLIYFIPLVISVLVHSQGYLSEDKNLGKKL